MANKRTLKKQIKYACGEVALHLILTRDCIEGVDRQNINDLVVRTAELQEHALKTVSFSFDKTASEFESPKAYRQAARTYYAAAYRAFTAEFNKKLQKIVDALNKAIPQAQREANKEVANA